MWHRIGWHILASYKNTEASPNFPSRLQENSLLKMPKMCLVLLIKDGTTWKESLTEEKICVPTWGNFPVTVFIIYLLIERDC